MNQILATNPQEPDKRVKKEKNKSTIRTSAPTDIKKVTKVFAIILLIFGVFIVGTGSYAMYRSSFGQEQVAIVNPVISVEPIEEDDTMLLLNVSSNIGIDTIVYQWNDGRETTLSGNGNAYFSQKIQIPTGSNILNITVTDIQQQQSTYSKKYELDSKINLEATEAGKIRITYESGDTEIDYMTYRWDDRPEETINIDAYTIDQEIETLSGRHTLTVVVVDVNNRTETKVQETNGVSIPKIDIRFNNDERTAYVVTVTDDVELQEVIVTLDEDETQKFGQKISGTEFQFEIPLKENSDNKMKVEVTNSDDQKTERMVMFTK